MPIDQKLKKCPLPGDKVVARPEPVRVVGFNDLQVSKFSIFVFWLAAGVVGAQVDYMQEVGKGESMQSAADVAQVR